MINKDDNLLSDIESDIDSDWKDIQKRIEKEKYKKEFEECKDKRPHIPDFKEFYSILIDFLNSYEYDEKEIYKLKSMISISIFYSSNDQIPKSLIRIWEALCNPREYNSAFAQCVKCHKKYDVAYKEHRIRITTYDSNTSSVSARNLPTTRVHCPECGEVLIVLVGSELIGVSKI